MLHSLLVHTNGDASLEAAAAALVAVCFIHQTLAVAAVFAGILTAAAD
jgi:hypothetical protein